MQYIRHRGQMITIITIIFTVILQNLNLKTEFRNSKQSSFEIFFKSCTTFHEKSYFGKILNSTKI